jgi:hypothetical protein
MILTIVLIICSLLIYFNWDLLINKISNAIFALCLGILRKKTARMASAPTLSKPSLNTAVIPFRIEYNGKVIYLPKNRELLSKMSLYKVEVELLDGSILDITQEPGIPYLLSLKQFNGKRFIFTSLEEGTIVEKTELDKAPLYLSFLEEKN